MVNEWEEVYDDDDKALPLHHLGDIWSTFKLSIPEPHFDILNSGLNYILLSHSDSLLPMQITEVLVDESVDVNAQKQIIWSLIVDNIIDLLKSMGFTISGEYIENKHLVHYIAIIDVVYTLPGYEDTVGFGPLLTNLDYPAKDRFIEVIQKLYGDDFDTEPYQYIIEDVSEVLLKALSDGLKGSDELVNPPQNIIDRVVNNKPFFAGTLTWTHIVNQGQLGGTVQNLLTFFQHDLKRILEDKGQFEYGKNIICLFFISELNNEKLIDAISKYLDTVIDDITVRMQFDELLKTFNLQGAASK